MKSKSHTDFFDSRAGVWEETCYPEPVRERLRELIREFKTAPGERILDVGTGPGILIPFLRKLAGESGRICAMDLSLEMVRQARKKSPAVTDVPIRADVHRIPFGSGMFDRVICFAAFPHFDDPQTAVLEMSRVLKFGGTLVVAHLMSRRELARHHATHASVAGDVLPDDERMRSYFTDAGLSAPEIVDIPGRYLAAGVKNR